MHCSSALIPVILFKNSVSTSKNTKGVTVTEVNYLMLFKEIIDVYSENSVKSVNSTVWVLYGVIEC
jgi:hypothetical protein